MQTTDMRDGQTASSVGQLNSTQLKQHRDAFDQPTLDSLTDESSTISQTQTAKDLLKID